MSVEVLEERAIEAPAAVEKETQKERCATLGGAAIACAGCPFVRFCEIKAEVEQGSFGDEVAGQLSEFDDDIFGLSEFNPLFPEADLIQEVVVNTEPQPEKVITPLPYEVKNTTISYIDKLMDDKVEFVFANSIARPAEPSRSDIAPKPLVDLVSTEVEQPVLSVEVPANQVKIEAFEAADTLELAYEAIEQVFKPLEVALNDEVESVADHPEKIETIADEIQPQLEEKIESPKNITENILRPKVEVVESVVVRETIQKIKKEDNKVGAAVTDFVDSPIFYNDDINEIIEVTEELAEVVTDTQVEAEAAFGPTVEVVDVIETSEDIIKSEDTIEEAELIQLKATGQPEGALKRVDWSEAEEDQSQPESRLYEALLNGNDDMVDPESRLVAKKIANKLKILRQLALRALRFSL